jgi:DNA-binding HxlR family transcriptional regulator
MTHPRRRNPISDCPLTAAIAAMGGKWKLLIVYSLHRAPRHFAALRQLMPAISQKVLTEQLRELMADDIVAREATGEVPAPVIYSLTDYGRRVVPMVETVRQWGQGHIEHMGEPQDPDALMACARPALAG